MAEGKKAEELNANQKIALVLAAMGADNASAVYKHLSDERSRRFPPRSQSWNISLSTWSRAFSMSSTSFA